MSYKDQLKLATHVLLLEEVEAIHLEPAMIRHEE